MHSFISVCICIHMGRDHQYTQISFLMPKQVCYIVSIYTLSMHALPLSVRRPFTHVHKNRLAKMIHDINLNAWSVVYRWVMRVYHWSNCCVEYSYLQWIQEDRYTPQANCSSLQQELKYRDYIYMVSRFRCIKYSLTHGFSRKGQGRS